MTQFINCCSVGEKLVEVVLPAPAYDYAIGGSAFSAGCSYASRFIDRPMPGYGSIGSLRVTPNLRVMSLYLGCCRETTGGRVDDHAN